jgi:hypothetical protein
MKYRGSCHCGSVAFEVEGEIKSALACNCSICQRKGSLLWFVPRDTMKLLTPEDAARVYEFNKHAIHHRFCPTCGIHPYADGSDAKGNRFAAINVRCLEDIELDSVNVTHYDGRSK